MMKTIASSMSMPSQSIASGLQIMQMLMQSPHQDTHFPQQQFHPVQPMYYPQSQQREMSSSTYSQQSMSQPNVDTLFQVINTSPQYPYIVQESLPILYPSIL